MSSIGARRLTDLLRYLRAISRRLAKVPASPAVIGQPDAWLTAIVNGYGIALAPGSAARHHARPGITYRRVTGVSPGQVCVAWPTGNETNPIVRDFVRCCLRNELTQHLSNQCDQQYQPHPALPNATTS